MRFEPRLLKRQVAKDMIDPTLHLLYTPSAPRPKLRRQIVIDRQPVLFRSLGNVPIEAREIDQNDTVDFPTPKTILGPVGQSKKITQLRQDFRDPHHSHGCHVKIPVEPRPKHLGTTKTTHGTFGRMPLHATNQIRCVKIAARLANGKKDSGFHAQGIRGIGRLRQDEGTSKIAEADPRLKYKHFRAGVQNECPQSFGSTGAIGTIALQYGKFVNAARSASITLYTIRHSGS